MGKMLVIMIIMVVVIFGTIAMNVQSRTVQVAEALNEPLDKIKAKNIGTYALKYAIQLYDDGAISNLNIPAPLCNFGDPPFIEYEDLETYNIMGGSIDHIYYSFVDLDSYSTKDSLLIKVEVSHGTIEGYECEVIVKITSGTLPSEVGNWSFNEGTGTDAEDSSVNDNDGSLINVDEGTVWTGGAFGSAIHLDGENDRVDLEPGVSTAYGDVLTIAGWVKLDHSFWGDGNMIMEQTNTVDGPIIWSLCAKKSTYGVDRATYVLKVNTRAGMEKVQIHKFGWEMDIYGWNFVVGSYDGTYSETQAKITLQVLHGENESFEETRIIDKWSQRDSTNVVSIGGGNFSMRRFEAQECINAAIDEVKLFNSILTPQQISLLYNNNAVNVSKIIYWSDNIPLTYVD